MTVVQHPRRAVRFRPRRPPVNGAVGSERGRRQVAAVLVATALAVGGFGCTSTGTGVDGPTTTASSPSPDAVTTSPSAPEATGPATPPGSSPTEILSPPTPPSPVVVTPPPSLPPGGTLLTLVAGESVALEDGALELLLVSASIPGEDCQDCPARAEVVATTADERLVVQLAVSGGMAPDTLEAARRFTIDGWVVRAEGFGDDSLDVRVVSVFPDDEG